MKLQEFKSALQHKMSEYFEKNHPMVKRNNDLRQLVICKIDTGYSSYLLDLQKGTCMLIEVMEDINEMARKENTITLFNRLNSQEQHYISVLLDQLITTAQNITGNESGSALWKNIALQLDKMPSSWRFFSNLRSLTLNLKEVLKQFPIDELEIEDGRQTKNVLEKLKTRIEQLMSWVKELMQKCNQLELENELLRKQVDPELIRKGGARRVLQQQSASLIDFKQEVLTELKQIQFQCDILLEQNKLLEANLGTVNVENKTLHLENAELRRQLMQVIQKNEYDNDSQQVFDKTETSIH